MKHYRTAFIGLGSMGRRHIRDLKAMMDGRGDICSIDVYRSDASRPVPEDISGFVDKEYLLSDPIPGNMEKYDIIFITNPTSMHFETFKRFLPFAKSMFIEKPVFDRTDIDLSELEPEILKTVPCYVACPLRYNPVLEYVRNNIDTHSAFAARAMSSSYLPEWRPGTDYRKCYSAHRDMGGGVGIDLIHEWDYLTALFGYPEQGFSIQTRISDLEIDSDDIASYVARTPSTVIELHLDYFGRKSQRTLEIFLAEDTVMCDLLSGTIDWRKSGRHMDFKVDGAKTYVTELEHFFDIIEEKCKNDNSIENALHTLKYAKGEF